MNKEEFEKKFRERIKPDTSNWRQRPAADRSKRDEFRRSQRVATRILEFLDENADWSRQRLADELGVSLQRISIILKGKANFTLSSIEKMEDILGINLLEETVETGVVRSQIEIKEPIRPEYGNVSSQQNEFHGSFAPINPAAFVLEDNHWFYTGGITFEELLAEVVAGESNFALAA
jgi:transcriptional regulator with XRE-family HTH domain